MRSRRDRRAKSRESSGVEETRVFEREQVSKPPGHQWLRVILGIVVAILLFGCGAFIGFLKFASHPSGSLIPPDAQAEFQGRVNVLVLGLDGGVNGAVRSSSAGKRSDVIMVASIDPELNEMGILSVPRDTRAFIPQDISDYEKIGHAHAYGGAGLAVETVEMFLKIPIHHYICVDFEGFKKVIDKMGGIDIDVPENMKYRDPFQDLVIDIPQGPAHLNGEEALGFVRYRQYIDADIGRIRAQEIFLRALMKQALSLQNVFKIHDLVNEMLPYFKTSLGAQDLLYLADVCRKMDQDHVKMGVIPGNGEDRFEGALTVNYWIHEPEGTAKIVDELVKGISYERNRTIKVAIENGCGVTGAADSLATILRHEGFEVVSVGNAKRQDYTSTRVQAGPDNKVDQVLVLRGIKSLAPGAEGYKSKDVPEDAHILVIIGSDYKMPAFSSGY